MSDYDVSPPRFSGFLMELMDGTLYDHLKSNTPSDDEAKPPERWVRRVVAILCDVLEGLSLLHTLGLAHRDLHAGNVLLSKVRHPPP